MELLALWPLIASEGKTEASKCSVTARRTEATGVVAVVPGT